MSDRETMASPRLEALRQKLEAGTVKALEAFWQEIAAQGAPLVEPISGDAAHSLVTLIWRGKETRSVALIGLLTDRRQGQWVYYQINPDVPTWVTDVLQAVASVTSDLNPYKTDNDVLAEMPIRSDFPRCS